MVDDEESLRRLLRRTLAGLGFAVLEADDGVSALGVVSASRALHLVITDLHMPRMDGHALARELRVLRPHLPILFITGRENPGLSGEVLRKPFGPEALLVAVSRLIGRVPGPGAASV